MMQRVPVNTQSHTSRQAASQTERPESPTTALDRRAESMKEASEASEPRGGQAEPADLRFLLRQHAIGGQRMIKTSGGVGSKYSHTQRTLCTFSRRRMSSIYILTLMACAPV